MPLALRHLGAALLLLLAWPGAGMTAPTDLEAALRGVWTLASVQDGARQAHDPRWTFMMTFEGDNLFSASSTEVLEKHLSGPAGSSRVPIQRDVRFLGRYRLAGDRLILTPAAPVAAEARAFAVLQFGPVAAEGSHSPRLTWVGGLQLTNPKTGRQLRFERHKRGIGGG